MQSPAGPPPQPDVDTPGVHLSVLGHVRGTRAGNELELGPPKHRAVLAALAMAEGAPLDADALAALVWPEEQAPVNPVSGLHVFISGLRRVLEPPRAPRRRPEVLVTTGGGYALDLAHVAIDAVEVADVAVRTRRLLRDAHTQAVPQVSLPTETLETVLAEVEQALGQWRGEAYADLVPTVGVSAARARLEAVQLSLLEDRAVTQLALGQHGEAAGQLSALVVERALDERLWSLYVVALAGADRQADALDALRRARHHLAEELGVDPGRVLRDLESMVLRQDPALLARRVEPPVVQTSPVVAPPETSPEEAAAPASVLVGRQREVHLLEQQLSASGTRIVQVVGEAGIGKSTLVADVLGRAGAADLVCVVRCPEDEGAPPLWPWVELLADLADALADRGEEDDAVRHVLDGHLASGTTTTEDADAEVARFRLFEAVERALTSIASRRRCLLVLEDLHWADSSTARLVSHLATAWAIAPAQRDLALVVTRRPDEAVVDRAGLGAALDALARHGTVRLDLAGLTPEDVTELAQRRTSWQVDESTAATLHARTRGNPFLLVELLRLGETALRAGEVPAGVADVLGRRLATLPEATRAALVTASVVGQEFDLDVVADAASLAGESSDEEDAVDAVLDALDPAVAAGLVVDTGEERMAFVHALTRDAVYASQTPSRRSRQHAQVAQALERRPTRRHAGPGEVARHWLAAGPRHASHAWRAARDAGLQLGRQLALDESADLLDDALTAQRLDVGASADEQVGLAEDTVAALLRAGRWERFLVRVDEAAAAAEERGDVELVARFSIMPAEAGPWTPRPYGTIDDTAVRRMRAILDRLPASDSDLRSRVMLALGSELYYTPSSARERQALVEEGLAMARRLGDPRLLGRVSQRAALVIWRGGNAEERLALATESVEAAERAGDVDLLQTSLELRMSAALEAGHIEAMLADVEKAGDLLADRPTIYHTVVLACLLVPWLAAQGRFEEAQARLTEAVRVGGGSQLPWAGLALGTAHIGLGVWRGDLADPEAEVMGVVAQLESTLSVLRLLVDLRADNLEGIRDYLERSASRAVADDFTSLFHHALEAEAAYVVGDPARAANAYAALAPDAGHVASAGTGVPIGPVDGFLALAAAATGDLARAARHAEDAAVLNRAWGLTMCDAWLEARRARGGW